MYVEAFWGNAFHRRGRGEATLACELVSESGKTFNYSVIDGCVILRKHDLLENESTDIGKKAGLFAKLQPGRARKRINAT